jgi:Na+-driven multidrug efflux pump
MGFQQLRTTSRKRRGDKADPTVALPDRQKDETSRKTVYKRICTMALPNILSNLLLFCPETVNVICMGHSADADFTRANVHNPEEDNPFARTLGNLFLAGVEKNTPNFVPSTRFQRVAAVGLGNCFINCIGIVPVVGFASALDTFVSTACGAGNYELMFVYLLRAFFVALLYFPFAFIILRYFAETILANLLHQDVIVSQLAAEYCAVASLGLLMFGWSECLKRFFVNTGKHMD